MKQVHDFGLIDLNTKRSCIFKLQNKDISRINMCSCITSKLNLDNKLTLTYNAPKEFPFQVDDDILSISKTIIILYKDGTEDEYKLTGILLKN